MIKSIIFDFDGVILDSVDAKGDAFFELFKDKGKEIQKISKEYHYNNLGISRYVKIDHILKKYLIKEITKKQIYLENFEIIVSSKVKNSKCIYGIKNFLEKNYKIYNFFISSATPTDELLEIIKYKKFSKYFIEIMGSPMSKIDHIKYIKKKYNYKKNEVLFIGDTNNDYLSAYNSRIIFIGVKNKYEDFRNYKYVIKNFYNFKNKLKKII